MEQTLIILKPDCVQRRLIGRAIQRFEDKGLVISAMKMIRITEALAREHYAAHVEKPFFPGLLEYITSSPVIVMVVSGHGAIGVARKIMGQTFGFDADPGTIRGDFGASKAFNLVHGSDSVEAAKIEISLYFKPDEIVDYAMGDMAWIIDPTEV